MGEGLLNSRYRLERRIAKGGMGVVHLARDEVLGRPVAIKVLAADLADNPEFIERFRREARNAAMLLHSNIAGIFDYGSDGDHWYMVMELVDGEDLAARLKRVGRLHWAETLALGEQIVAALTHAHARGLVHRDIKPGNILICEDGSAKVTDFGIALAAQVTTNLTQTGTALGTPNYMAPEQAKGDPIGPAADLYSLGVVMFECVTGDRPYHADSGIALAMQHVTAPVPDPRRRQADLPAAVAELIMRCMAKDPADRYPSAAGLREALAKLRRQPAGSRAASTTMVVGRPNPPEFRWRDQATTLPASEQRSTEARTAEARSTEARSPAARSADARTAEARPPAPPPRQAPAPPPQPDRTSGPPPPARSPIPPAQLAQYPAPTTPPVILPGPPVAQAQQQPPPQHRQQPQQQAQPRHQQPQYQQQHQQPQHQSHQQSQQHQQPRPQRSPTTGGPASYAQGQPPAGGQFGGQAPARHWEDPAPQPAPPHWGPPVQDSAARTPASPPSRPSGDGPRPARIAALVGVAALVLVGVFLVGRQFGGGRPDDPGSPTTVDVPGRIPLGLVGTDYLEAQQRLVDLGYPSSLSTADSTVMPAGKVLDVTPDEGTERDRGDSVSLLVSTGPGPGSG